jgi:tetratricopeptide (TPR) repeat protein
MQIDRPGEPRSREFDDLSSRGRTATLRGEFVEALARYTEARTVAIDLGGPGRGMLDAADLNIAMVHLQMGHNRRGEEGLREILLRTGSPRVAFSAAYNLASSLRKQGRYDRALSYADRALDHARQVAAPDLLAAGHSLYGNIHLNQNRMERALEEYQASMKFRLAQEGDTRYSRAILLENIGYCHLLREDLDTGISDITRALTLAREVGDLRCIAECLQDLCYGHLLSGNHEEALRLGCKALSSAMEAGYNDIEENCHYLLGELGSRTDDLERRDEHFTRLQEMHPELPFLKDFLCAVDVTHFITLKR